MIPMLMRLKVSRNPKAHSVLLPIFLVWILLAALMLLLLPCVLLAALLTWRSGQGKWLLMSYPMIASVLWHLSGLHIEVEQPDENILIAFL